MGAVLHNPAPNPNRDVVENYKIMTDSTPASAHAVTDVVIIGAGPVGLFAVFECGMLKMRCHVIDSLPETGGQCRALYPEKPIYDIPACPRIDGGELIDRLEAQAAPFAPVYHLGQQVVAYRREGDWHLVTTSTGNVIAARAVMIAAGAGAFGPNRPPLDGIEKYEDAGQVNYLVKSRNDYAGKTVVIAGGGDSAVDWALSLAEVAKKIYVVHRRDAFRAAPENVDRLRMLAAQDGGRVELVIPYQLHGLSGDACLQSVTVADLDGNTRALPCDALLPLFGLVPALGPLKDWDLGIALHHIPVDPSTCETKLQGVFAIGDVAEYPRKLKLILTGFAEAAQAAHAAHALVFPDQALHFIYSTSKGLP